MNQPEIAGSVEVTSDREALAAYLVGKLTGGGGVAGATVRTISVINHLDIALTIFQRVNGTNLKVGHAAPKATGSAKIASDNSPLVVLVEATGSALGVFSVTASLEEIALSDSLIRRPNAIGPPPEPDHDWGESEAVIIPQDSARLLVGIGTIKQALIVREQFWNRLGDSYTLAPGEAATVSFTRTVGVSRTSSSSEEVAQAIGVSASAGWGPISVAINASLSRTSSQSQQTTITSETSTYESRTVTSTSAKPETFLRWQLVDVYSVVVTGTDGTQVSKLTFSIPQDPPVIRGPYAAAD